MLFGERFFGDYRFNPETDMPLTELDLRVARQYFARKESEAAKLRNQQEKAKTQASAESAKALKKAAEKARMLLAIKNAAQRDSTSRP